MKIIHILQNINNLSAGPTYSVGSIAHYLTLRNHQVELFALGKKPLIWPYKVTLKLFNSRITKLGLMPITAWKYIWSQLPDKPAVIHGHGVWRIVHLIPLVISKNAALKWVWSPRGMFSQWSWQYKAHLKRPFWYLLQKPALKRVDCFHATSQEEVEDIRRRGFTQPIALIPNGVEVPPTEALSPSKENKLVFLSRIHTKKGVHLLIPAWLQIADQFPDWKLVIAGKLDSAYATEMQELAKTHQAPRLEFAGEVLGSAKTQLLSSARLFVLPSFSENFGIAIAEALAHKTPVITTIHTPWHNLNKNQCGWCIPATQDALIQALQTSLSIPSATLDEMGTTGRIWMENDFSWPEIAQKMEAVYNWLLEEGDIPQSIQNSRSKDQLKQ